ncbi:MAG: hypothetical protein HYV18_06720 [Gammaproteobacteria bacterium]|nr:hypothetical protein [Gammaproteobacteria bacterium]
MKLTNTLAAGLSFAFLSACSGGDGSSSDNGPDYCLAHFLDGTVTTNAAQDCSNCTVQSGSASIDDHGGTFASVIFGPGGGSVTVRATAPLGTLFSSGSNAGALMRFPSGVFENIGVRFTAYLAEAPVSFGGEFTQHGNISGNGSDNYYAFKPAGEFDAIQATISLSGNSTNQVIRLNEFCGDR